MATLKPILSPDEILQTLTSLPWLDMLAESWKLARKLGRGLADEGMYEVLEYESRLELQDKDGRSARFSKREKVRYRQNNIVAYQDHAWGDGEILQDYHCTPGFVVDRYRPGQKTFLLISLREVKKRGDIDDFHIAWGMKKGFVRSHELWETEVRHRTKQMKIHLVFPKERPPQRVWVEEVLQKKRQTLTASHRTKLANGRIQITWQTDQPRLNERYQLHWEW